MSLSFLPQEIPLERAIIPAPIKVAPDILLADAIALMSAQRATCTLEAASELDINFYIAEARASCVLVVEGTKLVGILTERDIVRMSAHNQEFLDQPIAQVMTSGAITIRKSEFTDIFSVLNLFGHHRIRHLPVVDEQNQVVGLLTQESVCQLLRPIDLLRLRLVSEVMTTQVIQASPETSVLAIAQLMANHQVSCVVIVRPSAGNQGNNFHPSSFQLPIGIITERDIVQFQALGLSFYQIQAQMVMSSPLFSVQPDDSLWTAQLLMQDKRLRRIVVIGKNQELLGIVTQTTLLQALNPIEIYKHLELLQEKVYRLENEKLQLLQNRYQELEQEVHKRTAQLQNQANRERLLGQIANRIRASLDLQDTINTIVQEVRQSLNCDRVMVYQFQSDLNAIVLAESVTPGCLSLLGHKVEGIANIRFSLENLINLPSANLNDIYTNLIDRSDQEMRSLLEIKAKILMPIIVGERIWGLMLVAQNDIPRDWEPEEIDLVKQITIQAAIAIQQAELYQQVQQELEERRRIETALRQSEELYRTTLSNISDAVFISDDHGKLTFICPNIEIVFGYRTAEIAQMEYISNLLGEALFEPEELTMRGQIFNIERNIQDRYGKSYTVLVNVKRVKIGEGTVLYTCRDISERKQVEKALQDSEERLRTIVETSASGLLAVNRTGTVVFANPAAATMFGMTPTELCGWFLGFPYTCGSQTVQEIELHQPAGNPRVATMQTAAISWQGQNACLLSLTDITDLKKTEALLRQSEAKYRLLVKNLPVGLVVHSADTNILTCNAKACELLGLTFAQMQGKTAIDPAWYFLREDETVMPLAEYPVNRVIATGQPLENYVVGVNRPGSGTMIWTLVNAFPVFDTEGELQQAIITFVDISDRKQAEADLQNLVEGAAAVTAQDFFPVLTQYIATVLGVRYVMICKREDDFMYTSAFWAKGKLQPNCHFPLENSACAITMKEGIFCCPQGLQQQFLGNQLLIALEVESYLGIALTDIQGNAIGSLCILDDKPLTKISRARSMLRVFAARVSAELERQQAMAALQQLNQELEARVEQRTAALRYSEERFRIALMNSPIVVFNHDLDLRYTWIYNPALGYKAEEVVGKFDADIFQPDDAQKLGDLKRQVLLTGQGIKEEVLVSVENDFRCYVLTVAPLCDRNGNIEGVTCAALDITDRKKTELALKESQYLIERITEASPDILYIYDLQEQRNVYINREIGRWLGYSSEEIQAMGNQLFLQLLHPDDLPKVAEHHLRFATASDTDIWEIEYRFRDREGNWHWFVSRDTLFSRDAKNCPKQILGAVSEITERKQIEAQLRQTNAELAHATRLKDEFLANMSHELRTPLNAILGMSEGLLEEVFGSLNDRQIKAIKTIDRSGKHLLDLINDILDLSKVESGKLELQLAPVAVSYLCESSLTFVRQQAIKKNIQLTSEVPTKLPEIVVDERRIRQILINLLNNAVKFTPEDGSVKLLVQTEQQQAQCFINFCVIDTGIGISQTDMGKLFQPFVQIDSSLSRKHNGTGLGLSLVQRLTQLHGGTVTMTSEVGKGTCFIVRLPYISKAWAELTEVGTGNVAQERFFSVPLTVDNKQVLSVEDSTVARKSASPPLILLAEDNEANIATISSYLSGRGYRLILAKNGEEAVNKAGLERPDLILMDIQMPGMDGLEAMRLLRNDPQFANTPIIALTALAMTGDRQKCLLAGANEYLTKPVKLKRLVEVIKDLLEKK